jgi:hypothetical protein
MNEELGAVASFAKSRPGQPTPSLSDAAPSSGEANRPADQDAVQSTDRSTSRSTERPSGKVVGRPKAFYITERLDQRLDVAVRYYQEVHGLGKIDRSTIVNAMLDNEAQWTDEALDGLLDRVISQLTSRLTG